MLTQILLLAGSLISASLVMAAELPLLPPPREIQQAGGVLQLDVVSVQFRGKPSVDDQRVLSALSTILGAGGVRIAANKTGKVVQLERTTDASSWQWDDAPGPDSSESYALEVTQSGAALKAPSARGLFYAVQTLRQLLTLEDGRPVVPLVRIRDWPKMRLRGVMLDLSHGPFPKFEELKRQIDFLAQWKTNQFYLYSETNIELQGYPLLSTRARLSRAQTEELIAYARDRFIDVVPCVELYGHLHDLVRIERYSPLGETPHGGEVNPLDPKTHALVKDWVDQLTAMFPSQWFHVGFDETYELGKMPGRKLDPSAAGATYLKFFEQVSSMVAAKGKRVMVWSDIILQHPEVIPKLPSGTVAVPWRYSDEPSYDSFVEPLAVAKVKFLAGTGVWNYYEAAPDFDHTIRNVNGFLQSTEKYAGAGLIHTEWADSGQILFRAADPAVAYGPVAGWSASALQRQGFYERYARLQRANDHGSYSRLLEVISESQSTLERALGTRVMSALWGDPFRQSRLSVALKNAGNIREARVRAEEAQELALSLLKNGPDAHLESLLYGARVLDFIALRQLYALEIDSFRKHMAAEPTRANYRLLLGIETSDHTHSRLFDLMDAAGDLKRDLRDLWLRDYLPYRLETAMGRWSAEVERWRRLQEELAEGYRDFRDGGKLP